MKTSGKPQKMKGQVTVHINIPPPPSTPKKRRKSWIEFSSEALWDDKLQFNLKVKERGK